MNKRINVAELPKFNVAPYLDNEVSIAAYLTDILEASDAGLLAAALGDIECQPDIARAVCKKIAFGRNT